MKTGRHVLDYTRVARPLDLGDIRQDAYELRDCLRGVDEIVLWQHQLDWLVKKQRMVNYLEKPSMVQYFEVHDIRPSDMPESKPAIEGPPAKIFGVPVRVVNPD